MNASLHASKQIQDKHRMAVERCQVALAGLTQKLDEHQKTMDATQLQIQQANLALREREQQYGIQFEWRAMTQRFMAFHEGILSQLQQEQSKLELAIQQKLVELNQHHVQLKVQERYVERVLREVEATAQTKIQQESDDLWARALASPHVPEGFSWSRVFVQEKS